MDECCGCRAHPADRCVVYVTDFLFALPMWLVYVLLCLPVLIAGVCLLAYALCRVSAWADREIKEAFAPVPSVADDFAAMGEQAESVAWIFGDERPRLTVIDGGEGTAA